MKEKIYLESTVKKIDQVIEKSLKNMGIVYPHESLAFFRSVYCELEKANKNNVILAQSVEDDIPQLIGCQVNLGHKRYGYIVGQIIHAFKNDKNEIEIVFTFHKSVYEKEYNEALESLEQGELTVSFELMVDDKDTIKMAGGVRKLTHVSFDGVGLLNSGETPACPVAVVFETAKRIIEDAFAKKDKNLVYASAKDITKNWIRIGELIETALTKKENKGETNMDKKTQEALLAKQKSFVVEEFGEEAVKEWTDQDFLNQDKIDALRESLKAETDEDQPKVEPEADVEDNKDEGEEASEDEVSDVEKDESSENVVKEPIEAEKMVVERDVKVKEVETFDDETGEERMETETEVEVKVDGKPTFTKKEKTDVTYTFAEVEEIKAQHTADIEEKDKEIAFLKENAKNIIEIRAELGEFVKELSDEQLFDETLIEIAKLKKENSELRKSNKVETASDDTTDEEDLDTGKGVVPDVESEETSDDRIAQYIKAKHKK